jgi:glutamine synthetase
MPSDHDSLGEDVKALRGPEAGIGGSLSAAVGHLAKAPEVQYHHEVYNQFLWNMF